MKRENFILGLHPFTNFVGIVSLVLTALLMRETRYFYLGFLLFFILAVFADREEGFLRSFTIFVLPLGLVLGLLIALFMPGDIACKFLFFRLKRQGLLRANILLSRLFLIAGGIILFFNIINIKEFILSLEDKGVARDQVFFILSLVQVFDEFNRNISRFIAVSKTRGVRIEGRAVERGKSLFPMLVPIYQLSRESMENNLLLMETRGFSLDVKPQGQVQLPYSRADRIIKRFFYILPLVTYIWRLAR